MTDPTLGRPSIATQLRANRDWTAVTSYSRPQIDTGEWLRARAAENTAHNEVVFAVCMIGLATLLLGVIAWFAS